MKVNEIVNFLKENELAANKSSSKSNTGTSLSFFLL